MNPLNLLKKPAKYLISPEVKQYKANLHCHSTLSDGHYTPERLAALYKENGYDILAITDHERPHVHQHLSTEDFLLITGYECYIRTNPECHYDAFAKELHLNLFARDPFNETIICYNEACCKYLRRDKALHEIKAFAGSQRPREYSAEYINEYIRTAKENGYIVAYNHPYWSLEEETDILAYEGLFSMEMCNYSSYVINGLEYNAALYDKLMRRGKKLFVHGSDDNHNEYPPSHPLNDSFGSFTMIMPKKFTYASVFDAMEKGDMYASMGPEIYEVSVRGDKMHVECSEAAHIYMYTGSKTPQYLHAEPGKTITGADFVIDERAWYVRASVQDAQGRWADTRAYSRQEIGLDKGE